MPLVETNDPAASTAAGFAPRGIAIGLNGVAIKAPWSLEKRFTLGKLRICATRRRKRRPCYGHSREPKYIRHTASDQATMQ